MSPSLGDLQHLVMVAVARLGDEAYGGAVQTVLRELADRDVTVSSVYVTLVRLEEQGLLTSRSRHPDPGSVGRPRRIFAVTEAGWDAMLAARRALERIWDGVEPA